MNEAYGRGDDDVAVSSVYVPQADGNALSRDSLLETLAYQERIVSNGTVESNLTGEQPIQGPPNFIAHELLGETADIATQRQAVRAASEQELAEAISTALADPERTGEYLPRTYEPGSTEAESFRFSVFFEQAAVTQQQEPLPAEDAQRVLFEAASFSDGIFTMGQSRKRSGRKRRSPISSG